MAADWLRTSELFWTREDVSKIYLVISRKIAKSFGSGFRHLLVFANAELVEGGAERFDSVANALARVPESVEFVAVHDAVRPLTPLPLIDAVFHSAIKNGAAMAAVPWRTLSSSRSRFQPDYGDNFSCQSLASPNAPGLPPRLPGYGLCQTE